MGLGPVAQTTVTQPPTSKPFISPRKIEGKEVTAETVIVPRSRGLSESLALSLPPRREAGRPTDSLYVPKEILPSGRTVKVKDYRCTKRILLSLPSYPDEKVRIRPTPPNATPLLYMPDNGPARRDGLIP